MRLELVETNTCTVSSVTYFRDVLVIHKLALLIKAHHSSQVFLLQIADA